MIGREWVPSLEALAAGIASAIYGPTHTVLVFAAPKTATWADRRAPRDLWDSWALSRISAIDAKALETIRADQSVPGSYVFESPPSEAEWQSQLAGQTRRRRRTCPRECSRSMGRAQLRPRQMTKANYPPTKNLPIQHFSATPSLSRHHFISHHRFQYLPIALHRRNFRIRHLQNTARTSTEAHCIHPVVSAGGGQSFIR